MATLQAFPEQADALIDDATRGMPAHLLRLADRISRRWLVRSGHGHLDEIDAIARQLNRPGAYFLSVNYEWGCTVAVRAVAGSAELIRILDWRTPGLGRHVVAADIDAPAGRFVALTWPGFTGVLQAMATGRFAAAINQAPMPRQGGGLLALDWLANKIEVWQSRETTAAHLLREVFEQETTFAAARRRLIETPLAAPAIFSLVGTAPDELSIIERQTDTAHIHDGPHCAANAWQAPLWHGRARGADSLGRVRQLGALGTVPADGFDWLQPPVLNPTTRLAAVFTPATGNLLAQGYDGEAAATRLLSATLESH